MEYNDILSGLINHHAPLKSKMVRVRPLVPWFTAEIGAAKRLRRKAERRWRRSGLQEDFIAFKKQRNHVTYLMNDARKRFYTDFISDNSTDQRKLFRAAKKLLSKKEELCFPDYSDITVLVNDVADFFAHKIEIIHSDIAGMEVSFVADVVLVDREAGPDKQLSAFKPLSESDVCKLIQTSTKKTCSLDPVPTSLVVSCLDLLLPIITCIVNSSLAHGYFPNVWKEAIVTPLLKNPGKTSEFSNLRPISNLQFISKLTERAVFEQLHNHMIDHSLYPLLQSAYRTAHSTETALLKVQNDILMNMNSQQVTLLVLLDLSAAFDTANHAILLNRLKSSFGISGSALEWLASYLSNSSHRVSFEGTLSESHQLSCSVPQGSCLGPLLFTVYASKLFDVIKGHLPHVHAYADDTQLYLSFKADSASSQNNAVASMGRCIKDIRSWMVTDRLKLNDKKTEFILIGTRQQLAKVYINGLVVGASTINPVTAVKNLGTWFDEHMNMCTNINKTCKSSFFHMYNIRRIRKYLSRDSTHTH